MDTMHARVEAGSAARREEEQSLWAPGNWREKRAKEQAFARAKEASAAYELVQHSYLYETLSMPLEQPLNFEQCRRVLDVGCGTGAWAMDVARNNPTVWVLGIDGNEYHVQQAQAVAVHEGLANIEFRVCEPCELARLEQEGYSQRHFDLLHMQCVAGHITPGQLPDLARDLVRLCRYRGKIVWSEMELPITNSDAYVAFNALLVKALRVAGRLFCPGTTRGLTALMGAFLRENGCRIEQDEARAIDLSADMQVRVRFIESLGGFGRQVRPYVLATGVTTPDDFDKLLDLALQEMQTRVFCGVCFTRAITAVREVAEQPGAGYW
jgi:ubiquinone/menaquinone biosynthesis C-methylase UbiE